MLIKKIVFLHHLNMEVKIYKSNLNVNKSVQCQTIEKNSSKKILLFITLSLPHPMIFRHTNFNCTKRDLCI